MYRTAPAPKLQQVSVIPSGEMYHEDTQSSHRGISPRPLFSCNHSREASQNTTLTDPFHESPRGAFGHTALQPGETQIASNPFSPGGRSETYRPLNGMHSHQNSQDTSMTGPFQQSPHALSHAQSPKLFSHPNNEVVHQEFPFAEQPSTESITLEDFPSDMDLKQHGRCIALLQDAQAALGTLKMRVNVSENNNEILAEKIKSLTAEMEHLGTSTPLSDEQNRRDRLDQLTRQVEYLSTLPHNEKYLRKIEMFETEARAFRETKFRIEQAYTNKIYGLENDKEVLEAKLKTTEECYSDEVARLSIALQREHAAKKMAHQALSLAEVKVSKLEGALDRERSTVTELQDRVHNQHQFVEASDTRNTQNVRCMSHMLQQVTMAIDHSNQQLAMTNRALNNMQGLPADPPVTPRRRH